MKDVYTESVVLVPSKPIYKIAKYLLMVLTVLSFLSIGIAGLLSVIATAIFGFLLYQVMQKDGGEYEYVHTNNCFDVDLVVSNARRKQLFTIDLDQVLLIAKEDSQEMDMYGDLPVKDYSGKAGPGDRYAMVYAKDGKRQALLLALDPGMLCSLKSWIPGKVK